MRRLTSELEEANARSTPEKTESTGMASTTTTAAAGAAAAPMSASRERAARERVAWESERSQLMAEVAMLRQQAATVAEVTAEAAARDGSSDVSALKPSTTGGGGSGSVSFASAEGEVMVDDEDLGVRGGAVGDGAGGAGMMDGDLESVRRENSRLAEENAKLRKEQQAATLRREVETYKTHVRASRRHPRVHTQSRAEDVSPWCLSLPHLSPNRSVSVRRTAQGNYCFHQGKYSEAMSAYTSALEVMGRAEGAPDAHVTAVLHCNRSACHQGLKRYMDAVLDASHALLHDAQYPRAYQVSE